MGSKSLPAVPKEEAIVASLVSGVQLSSIQVASHLPSYQRSPTPTTPCRGLRSLGQTKGQHDPVEPCAFSQAGLAPSLVSAYTPLSLGKSLDTPSMCYWKFQTALGVSCSPRYPWGSQLGL